MLETTVVEDHIHHNLQAFSMSLITEFAIVIISAKTRIYTIVIRCGIAMICGKAIRLIWRVVLEYRCKPKSSNSKFLEIVKVFTDTIEVTTMTQRRLCAILLISSHSLNLRIMVCALSKTVRHKHIEHIGIGESHTLVATHLTSLQLILHLYLAKLKSHSARLGILKVHIDKKIVWRVQTHKTIDGDTRIISGDRSHITYPLAINHQLNLRILQSDKPIGGVDSINY